jgi:hypothetical protein
LHVVNLALTSEQVYNSDISDVLLKKDRPRDGSINVQVITDLSLIATNNLGHRNCEVLHVAETSDVLAVSGDADGAAGIDSSEEIFLQRVIVHGTVDLYDEYGYDEVL